MKLTLHHINLATENVTRMDDFYRDVLGLERESAGLPVLEKSKGYAGDVAFVSMEKSVMCGIRWHQLDWVSQRLSATVIAEQEHNGWLSSFQRNFGYVPDVLERRKVSVNGIASLEFIDDLKGGRSIKLYTVAGKTVFKLDCETYSALFQGNLGTFRRILSSFEPR